MMNRAMGLAANRKRSQGRKREVVGLVCLGEILDAAICNG